MAEIIGAPPPLETLEFLRYSDIGKNEVGTMIDEPIPTRRALLVWQSPLCDTGFRTRHAVGELVQRDEAADGDVTFSYFNGSTLENAEKDGFAGYPGLPIGSKHLEENGYRSLIRRLPPRSRGDFGDIVERFGLSRKGLDKYTGLTLLAYTGARLTRDSFSICETFDGFDVPFRYVFDVTGFRHFYEDTKSELAVGKRIGFEREPSNQGDPDSVRLTLDCGAPVGYINRFQAKAVGDWLDGGEISASVFRINGRSGYPRLFVEADIRPAEPVAKSMVA